MVWASYTLLKDMVTVTTTSVTLATVDSTDTATTASTTGRRSTTPEVTIDELNEVEAHSISELAV